MRICQLSHVETTYNFLAPLFTALARDGHEVVAACNLDQGGAVLRRYLGEDYEFHRVQVSRRITARAFTTEVAELARYLARQKFDVLHLHGPLAAVQGRLAAGLARVPVVISHAHGFYFHDGMGRTERAAHITMERLLGRYLTDHIITVNSEDRDFALRHRFTADPTQVIGTPGVGIDIGRFAPLDRSVRLDLRRRLGVPPEELVVTFVGRLVAEKGVLDLARAFTGLLTDQAAWLMLVGDVSPTERDQRALSDLEALQRADPRAAERTLRLGQRRDIPEILAASDIFVLPSYREGMPVSLLEAMACAVPSITTDIRGCRQAVEGGEAGVLVPAGDPAALAEALRKLAADPDERTRLGAAGRALVEKRHTTAQGIAPVMALYRRIDASRTPETRSRRSLIPLARKLLPMAVRARLAKSSPWRIAVEHVTHPLDARPLRSVQVFSDAELDEFGIDFVADPFGLHLDGVWHLFFEQVMKNSAKGEIGLATSTDLKSWSYQGAVLTEPFHLSYPKVVVCGDEVLMIPESNEARSVRAYRAVEFPHRWELGEVLLDGLPYKDNTPFEHDGAHFLLTETSETHTHDHLRLFMSDDLLGPWEEHPASPLVVGNPDAGRPAGSVLTVDGALLRFSQSCTRRYGESVRGHRIEVLSRSEYRESALADPVLAPRPEEWTARAMHHIDAHPLRDNWIRFVDGYR